MPRMFEEDLREIDGPNGSSSHGVIQAQKKQTELRELIQTDFVYMLEQCHEEVLRMEDEIPDVANEMAKWNSATVKLDLRSLKHFRGFLENVVQPLNGYEDLYECGKLPASCPECRSRRYDVCQVKYLQWHGKCRKCGHVHLILSDNSVVPVAPERKIPQETAFSLGLLHAMGMRLDKTQEFAIGEPSHIILLDEVQDWAMQIGKLLADGIAREIDNQSVVVIDEMRIAPDHQLAVEDPRSPERARLVVHTSGHMEEHLGIVFKCADEKKTEAEVDACFEHESYLSKVISRREQKEQLSLLHLRRKVFSSVDFNQLNRRLWGNQCGLSRVTEEQRERAIQISMAGLKNNEPAFYFCSLISALTKCHQGENWEARGRNEEFDRWNKRVRRCRVEFSTALMDSLDTIMVHHAEALAVKGDDGKFMPKVPDSPMADAICYYLNNKERFRVFLTDTSMQSESPSTSRCLHALLVLRNALEFDRSGKCLDSLCVYVTLLETARLNGFNAAKTLKWLRDFGRAYYLHRANATLTEQVNNCGRALDEELTAFTPESAKGFDVEPWLPWNYGRRKKRAV